MTAPDPTLRRIVFVTGPSGAGRSSALNVLEDAGFEVIDNLPMRLMPMLFDEVDQPRTLALGIDARNRDFSTNTVIDLLGRLSMRAGIVAELLFVDCSTDVLLRRFSETRRRHPMAPADRPAEGIQAEQDLLAPLRARADAGHRLARDARVALDDAVACGSEPRVGAGQGPHVAPPR